MPVTKKPTTTVKKKIVKKTSVNVGTEKAEKAEAQIGLKLRIKLRAYDHKIIDNSARQIIDIANRFGAEVLGPVPLPTEILKYTVNRSSFVHKNAREQFEMRVHKRVIDILNPNQEIIESLRDLNLPSGVDITIKI
jgi:small subunit ribosomal protein S10